MGGDHGTVATTRVRGLGLRGDGTDDEGKRREEGTRDGSGAHDGVVLSENCSPQ